MANPTPTPMSTTIRTNTSNCVLTNTGLCYGLDERIDAAYL